MGADDYDTTKFNSVLEAFNAATTRVTYQGRLPGSILVVAPDAAPGIGRSLSTLVEWPVQYTAARNRHDQGYGKKTRRASPSAHRVLPHHIVETLHAQGGTRTRKTLESGDFESPASANSATRAPQQNL